MNACDHSPRSPTRARGAFTLVEMLVVIVIIGILGGKLAVLGAGSVVLSGLVVKNLYEPLFPGKPEKHYMFVARLTVPLVLLLGIGVALYLHSVIALLKFAQGFDGRGKLLGGGLILGLGMVVLVAFGLKGRGKKAQQIMSVVPGLPSGGEAAVAAEAAPVAAVA